jgi:hypothetical protein
MDDKVYTGTLDVVALQAAVDALRPQALYGIVESLTEIDFSPPHQEPINVTEWPKGRIFCEAFELRWEQVDRGYRTVFASAGDQMPPDGLVESDLQLQRPNEPVEYYCWNERNPRLGRTLGYRCVPGNGDVKLAALEYRDDHGRLVFWRYTEMKREGER